MSLVVALEAHDDFDEALRAAGYSPLAPKSRSVINRIARLSEASKREQDAIAEIGNVSSRSSVEDILCRVLDGVAELIPFDYGNVTLIDWNSKEIEVLSHKTGTRTAERRDTFPYEKWSVNTGITGWAATHAQPCRVADVTADKRYLSHDATTSSELVVPLVLDGLVLGLLNLESRHANYFTERHSRLLTRIAEKIVPLVYFAREHETLLKNLGELQQESANLVDLQRTLVDCKSESDLLETAAERIVVSFPQFELAVARQFDQVNRWLLLQSVAKAKHLPAQILLDVDRLIPLDSLSGRVIRDLHEVSSFDVQADPKFFQKELAKSHHLRGMLAVPLFGDAREPIGCLTVYSTSVSPFRAADSQLLRSIGDYLGVVLSNLRAHSIHNAIRGTQRTLRSGAKSADAFDRLARLICEETGALGASIFLIDGGLIKLRGTTGIAAKNPNERIGRNDYGQVNYQLGEGKTGWVVATGKPLRLVDRRSPELSGQVPRESHKWEEIRAPEMKELSSFIAVPIRVNGDLVGVARAVGKKQGKVFTPHDESVLSAVAEEIGVALSTNRRVRVDSDR